MVYLESACLAPIAILDMTSVQGQHLSLDRDRSCLAPDLGPRMRVTLIRGSVTHWTRGGFATLLPMCQAHMVAGDYACETCGDQDDDNARRY
jgi:hypothetical protein